MRDRKCRGLYKHYVTKKNTKSQKKNHLVCFYLYKHITPAVKVICQLVTFGLPGQDGLHLHHPGSYKHIVGLNIPEEKDNQNNQSL